MSSSALCLRLLPTIICLLTPLKSFILFGTGFPLTQWKCRSSVTVSTCQCDLSKLPPHNTWFGNGVSFNTTIQPLHRRCKWLLPHRYICFLSYYSIHVMVAQTVMPSLLCLLAMSYEQPAKLLQPILVTPGLSAGQYLQFVSPFSRSTRGAVWWKNWVVL